MAAMIFKNSCLSEVSLECVNRVEYLYVLIGYNIITSQIMDCKLCIVGQRWKYALLLIGFVHLHRVICLMHDIVCTYNILNCGEREVVSP